MAGREQTTPAERTLPAKETILVDETSAEDPESELTVSEEVQKRQSPAHETMVSTPHDLEDTKGDVAQRGDQGLPSDQALLLRPEIHQRASFVNLPPC